MVTPKTDSGQWFDDEVKPHEPSLRAYLKGSFPSVRDVDDLVQESYLRMWKARAAQPVRSVKAFLFTVSRHLALDLVRRNQAAPIESVGDLDVLPILDERLGVTESVNSNERVRLLGEAIATLPPRCREVTILRKLQGHSQREVAEMLHISEKAVEAQVARGVRRCEEFLRERGVHGYHRDEIA